MLQGWQHIKINHTCTSEAKYSCLCSALSSVEMKKYRAFSLLPYESHQQFHTSTV